VKSSPHDLPPIRFEDFSEIAPLDWNPEPKKRKAKSTNQKPNPNEGLFVLKQTRSEEEKTYFVLT
jgi:hypothetical protein